MTKHGDGAGVGGSHGKQAQQDTAKTETKKRERPRDAGSGPLACQEPESGIIVFVESDRKHITAIDKDGKILWHQDLSAKPPDAMAASVAGMKADEIYPLMRKALENHAMEGPYLHVIFRDRSFGALDVRTGRIVVLGLG